QSFDNRDIAHAIRTGVFNSFLGEITYSSQNSNLNPGIIFQNAYNVSNIIGPYTVSNSSLIYPMPKWDERYESRKIEPIEIAVIIFSSLFILNSLAWAIYVIIKRKEKVIYASSPVFLVSMIAGSILIYISILLWMPIT